MDKKNNIVKSSIIVMLAAVVAKLIGFFKSILQASYYGSNQLTDSFNMANGLVANIIYMLTSALALAFVPIYIKNKKENGEQISKKNTSITVTKLGGVAIIISSFLMFFAPFIIKITAPFYVDEQYINTVIFFRIMIVGLVFVLEANVFQYILNAERRYLLSSVSSISNSFVLIAFIIFGYKVLGIYALVLAIPCSYIVQFLILYISGRRFGRITFRYGLKDNTIRVLLYLSIPILISNATIEINETVDRLLLSSVEVGAVTAVSYSAVLFQFVINIISMPISSVLYTELSEDSASLKYGSYKIKINKSVKILLIISIPITIIIAFYCRNIVKIVYGRGNYSNIALRQTAEGLFFYGLCIIPETIKQILTKAFYSLNNTKTPMVIGVLEVICNILLSIIFVSNFGISGIVGATAIASSVFGIILFVVFQKHHFPVFNIKDCYIILKYIINGIICYILNILFIKYCFFSLTLEFLIGTSMTIILYFLLLLIQKDNILWDIIRKLNVKNNNI